MILLIAGRSHALVPVERSELPYLRSGLVVSEVPVISIIDDDESVRTATGSLVRSLGYVVHSFASAAEFLHSAHVRDTSCLISDVQMPKMGGLELQRHLRDGGYHIPIIFITAFPDAEKEARALKAGAVCFLNKPFDGVTLLRCLAEALQRGKDTPPTT
jgi:FixJ family two-component response regulator